MGVATHLIKSPGGRADQVNDAVEIMNVRGLGNQDFLMMCTSILIQTFRDREGSPN